MTIGGGGGGGGDSLLIGPFLQWWDKRTAKRDAKRTAKLEAKAPKHEGHDGQESETDRH